MCDGRAPQPKLKKSNRESIRQQIFTTLSFSACGARFAFVCAYISIVDRALCVCVFFLFDLLLFVDFVSKKNNSITLTHLLASPRLWTQKNFLFVANGFFVSLCASVYQVQ